MKNGFSSDPKYFFMVAIERLERYQIGKEQLVHARRVDGFLSGRSSRLSTRTGTAGIKLMRSLIECSTRCEGKLVGMAGKAANKPMNSDSQKLRSSVAPLLAAGCGWR